MVTWSLEQIDYLFAGGLKDSFLISLRAWCRKIRRKWSYRIIGRLGLLTIIIADKCGKALAVNDMVRDKDQLTGHLPNQNRGVDFLLSGYNDQLKSVGCKVGFGQANMRSEQIFGPLVKWLRRWIFIPEAGFRLPYGLPSHLLGFSREYY